MSSVPLCQHLKVNGEPCGSPALKHHRHCYFHDEARKRERACAQRQRNLYKRDQYLQFPVLEDANAIQVALMQTIDGLLDGRLNERQTGLLLYALQTASSNLKHTTFQSDAPKPAEPWVTELLTALRALPEPGTNPESTEACHPERSTSASQTRTCGVEGPSVSSASAHPGVADADDQSAAHSAVVGAADSIGVPANEVRGVTPARASEARLAVPAEENIPQIHAGSEERPHAVNVGHSLNRTGRSIVNAKIVNRQSHFISSLRSSIVEPLTASAGTR